MNLVPKAFKVSERMTAPRSKDQEPTPNVTTRRRFHEVLRTAVHQVVFRNPWIIPLAWVLGSVALIAAHRSDASQGLERNASHTLLRALLLLLPGLVLLVVRTRGLRQMLAAALIFVPAAAVWLLHDQSATVLTASAFGEVPVPEAFLLRRYLVALGLLSPLLVLAALHWSTLLDRYLLREFLYPFLFCLVAFFSIWLVFDLNDNLSDFREHRPTWADILNFYVVQIPHIFTKIAEAAVLISTVYALSRLSRSNEFIAMLGSGRGFARTLLPLFLCGAYISFLYLVFNFQWAPRGEGKKEFLLDQFSGDQKTAIAKRHLYVNEPENRTWYIGEIPYTLDSEEFRFVDVQEQNAEGRRTRSIQAASATWDPSTRRWSFYEALVTEFPENALAAPIATKKEWHHENEWEESRWQVINQRMEPDYLGVPGLVSYLRTAERDQLPTPHAYLTNLHHRWAAPWGCLAILFVAAPLGIAYSRRGILGGVAWSVFLFGAVLFLTELFLALGKSGYLGPLTAAWLANSIFLVLGSLFLYLRARNRSFSLRRRRVALTTLEQVASP